MSELYIPESRSFSAEKAKILADEKEKAWGGITKVASAYMREQDPYPSPYLNLSDYQLPRTMVEIFKWCRYFYKFDSLIGGAVNTMARFPVTDILFDEAAAYDQGPMNQQDSPSLALYKELFEELHINDELIRIGIDYWLYGNCFVFGEFDNFSQDPDAPDIRWSKIFRLDPSKITIELDPLTQDKTYKWEVPAKIKRICKDKKPADRYAAIPDMIKKAARENKPVILNSRNIYHFSREGESGDGSVWGTPLILNVMKQLAYRNLLRQAQEAIAREHVIPFRVYYLNPTERMDPSANWNNTARAFGQQLEQAAKDPNYKVVSPVPVNVLTMGGQGRALMLTPEIEQLQAEILAGMGVPREFIFGGVSYSAASISLRTLENQFINYRLLLIDFLNNFVIKRMAEVRGEWASPADKPRLITVKLADLKMQDDIQQKQMIINMNAGGKVSDEYTYNMLGMDPQKMKVQLEVEIFERMDRERRMQMFQVETQLMIQQQQMMAQAQLDQQAMRMGMVPMGQDPAAAQGGQPVQQTAGEEDWGMAKIAMSPSQSAQLDTVVNGLVKLSNTDRQEVLRLMSSDVKQLVLQKMAAANPNTISNSGTRNVKLWQMQQHDPVGHMRSAGKIMADAADEDSKYKTDLMSQPDPVLRPGHKKNLGQ